MLEPVRFRSSRALTLGLVLVAGPVALVSQAQDVPPPAPPASPPAQVAPAVPPAEAGPAPEIYAIEPIVELGEVLQGEVKKHTFIFGNRGAADLIIHRVNPTCGCTVASVKTQDGVLHDPKTHVDGTPFITLKPEETAEVLVEFNSAGQQAHKLEKSIVVVSSDNKQPALQLTLRVDVKKAYSVEPNPLNFGEINRGKPASLTTWIKLMSEDDLTLTGFKDPPTSLDVKWEKGTAPDGTPGIAVTVSLKPDSPTGLLTHSLIALTNHPRIPEIPITVYAQVKSEVSFDTGNPISRERLDFEVVTAGQEVTKEVTITNGNPAVPYKLLGVEVESAYKDKIFVVMETVEEGAAYKVKVTTAKDLDARFFRGTLKFIADHPDLKTKALDFHGWVKKG